MPAELVLYDGASPAADITVDLGPGDSSATYARTLVNDGDETATGVTLILEALDASTWYRNGLPILDQLWFTARVTGTSFDSTVTGTKPLGAGSRLVLPDIPAGGEVDLDIAVNAPSSIGTAAIQTHLVADWQRNSYPISEKIGTLGNGITPGWRNASLRRVASGFAITASGAASVVVEDGLVDFDGQRVASLESSHTLNQNDSAAAALGSGESYIARLSVGATGTVTATKGTKSATPTAPALPTDEVHLGFVTVDYQVGGTSVIDQADVDQGALVRGDYWAEAGGGLALDIHAGTGIHTTDHARFHESVSVVTLTASDTNYVFALPDGTFADNVTGEQPIDGAELMWEADTDGSGITAIRDRRVYLTRPWDEIAITIPLGAVSAAQTAPVDYAVLPEDSEVTRVRLEGGAVSGGASGSYILEVTTADEGEPTAGTWTTIYTSSGTTDRRPTIAYNATVLANESEMHEVRRVLKNRRIGAWIATIPSGGTITNAKAIIYVRRYR